MSVNLVDLYILVLQKDVKADLQCAKCCKQVDTHEVCKVEFAVRFSCKERTALVEACDMLAGKIVVCQESAAVCVTLKCLVVKCAEQLAHIDFHAECFCKLFENIYPCIQIGRAVVAVYHCYLMSCRCRHDINCIVRLGKVFFQYDHAEYGSTCGHVSGTYCYAVCCCHTGACISFRRANRDACLQLAGYVKLLCALCSQCACALACYQYLREDL